MLFAKLQTLESKDGACCGSLGSKYLDVFLSFRKALLFAIFSGILLESSSSWAGKVEGVQTILLQQCRKAVTQEEALYWVRVLYLTCVPEASVRIDATCEVKCAKQNTGVVLGK